jgi:hypothetical protein
VTGWNGFCEKESEPQLNPMTPIDPIPPVPPHPRSATAPPYVDEDPNLALVEQGLEAAEDETRDAVADAYEAAARRSDDPAEALDDIDFTEAEDESSAPELAAMHEDWVPSDGDENE